MRKPALASLLVFATLTCSPAGVAATPAAAPEGNKTMTVEEIKQAVLGEWVSIAQEVRPSAVKNPDGTLKPFYLTRDFKASSDDRFELTIVNFVDPYGKTPLARIFIRGHMLWRGDHPIAPGAQKVDLVADEAFEVTQLVQPFADILNRAAVQDYAKWEVGETQSVFGKTFTLSASPPVRTSWNTTWCSSPMACCSGARGTLMAAASTQSRTAQPIFRSRSSASDDRMNSEVWARKIPARTSARLGRRWVPERYATVHGSGMYLGGDVARCGEVVEHDD